MPLDLANTAIVPFPPAAARAAAIAARRVAPDLVLVPERTQPKAAKIIRPQFQFSDCLETVFSDCLETVFGGLVAIGALLFAAAMLRFCWAGQLISGRVLHVAADSLYVLAAIIGCVVMASLGHGVFSLLKQRG